MNKLTEIKQKLDTNAIKYTMHEVPKGTGVSVEEHLKVFGLDAKSGCATLVFMTDNGPVALLRRDDCKIDNKKLRKVLGTNSMRFLTPEELLQHTGYEIGMVSPIVLDIPKYIDAKVLEMESVRVGTGGNEFSLEINPKDLQKLIDAKVVDVCEIKAASGGMKRVLSGITPSSSKGLHLGNYLGAVKPQVEFQDKGNCFYFIADYHALNTVHDPAVFANNVYETYLDYLALGIDLQKTTFFVESHVRAIFELTEILNNVVTLSEMKRMHAYKDKLADPEADIDAINMGLFNYPILMAADILVFEPDFVPVGEDQAQHVEICRDIAKSFNFRYGNTLKVPELYVKASAARVTGTDGVRKMSKSLGNDITIFGDEKLIHKQIYGIVTDPNRIRKDDPGDPAKNVIFKYFRLMDFDVDKIVEYEERYKKGTIGDVELKEVFYKYFIEYFETFRGRRKELQKDKEAILKLMKENAIKANDIANYTINKVRKSIGAIYD